MSKLKQSSKSVIIRQSSHLNYIYPSHDEACVIIGVGALNMTLQLCEQRGEEAVLVHVATPSFG